MMNWVYIIQFKGIYTYSMTLTVISNGDEYPLNLYYAYGVRNSFGINFDPDTENGPEHGDEINLVEPGFNSGWVQVQGMSSDKEDDDFHTENLVDFDGKGKYSEPEFEW